MTTGRADFFRRNAYPDEVGRFADYIADNVTDENIDTYITNGDWTSQNGRDLEVVGKLSYARRRF